jgi:hypothetical protein
VIRFAKYTGDHAYEQARVSATADTCPACGVEWPAMFRHATGEGAICACLTPLIRRAGQPWRVDRDAYDGAAIQRLLDEGWRRSADGTFEKPGEPALTLDNLRERWRQQWLSANEGEGCGRSESRGP